jgi:hypothetical protein
MGPSVFVAGSPSNASRRCSARASCYHRLLIPDAPIADAFVDGLVANVVGGTRP